MRINEACNILMIKVILQMTKRSTFVMTTFLTLFMPTPRPAPSGRGMFVADVMTCNKNKVKNKAKHTIASPEEI